MAVFLGTDVADIGVAAVAAIAPTLAAWAAWRATKRNSKTLGTKNGEGTLAEMAERLLGEMGMMRGAVHDLQTTMHLHTLDDAEQFQKAREDHLALRNLVTDAIERGKV